MKILDGKFLTGNASFSTPFKEAENRFFNTEWLLPVDWQQRFYVEIAAAS